MNKCVETLLSELVRFQDRQFLRDPTKAKAKRRYVCGLREVTKHLNLRRLKCVIMPPNLDRIQSTGMMRGKYKMGIREGRKGGRGRKGEKWKEKWERKVGKKWRRKKGREGRYDQNCVLCSQANLVLGTGLHSSITAKTTQQVTNTSMR